MLRSIFSRAGLVLLAALLLPLAACDSGGSNDEEEPAVDDGRVSVSISGEASGSFEGFASFYDVTDPETGDTVFGLVLSNTDTESPNTSSQFIVMARQSSRPGTGVYSFANLDEETGEDLPSDQFIAIVSSAIGDGEIFGFYISQGGTLTIDRSSDDTVAGSFEIEAVGFELSEDGQETNEVEITVEGAFNANSTNNFFLPFDPEDAS